MKKPWWSSTIIWVNLITAAGAILQLAAHLTFVTPREAEMILFGVAALNVVLRTITPGQPISEIGARKARALRYGGGK